MGSFHLAKMSFRNLFNKPATKAYPAKPPVYTAMTKGRVVNDIDACILCGICAKKCPADAIAVDKPASTWTLDPFACVQCYSCVRACPKDCLAMLPDYTAASREKHLISMVKPQAELKA
jgi:formate hydrogenlyase subunit 6/NADH:ubiquinone oxidoreductase subunit I